MDALPAIALTVGGMIASAAMTYGAVVTRLTRAEKDIEAQGLSFAGLRERLDRSREDQGARIGAVEERTAQLQGQSDAILTMLGEDRPAAPAPAARARRPTRPPSTGGG